MPQRIQFRRGTAAQWTSANPILAEGELGLETDTQFYKIGDGLTSWNSAPYGSLRTLDQATVLEFDNQSSHPATPVTDILNVYGKDICGKMLLRIQGPSGITSPLQPSLFQNNVAIISSGSGSVLNTVGTGVTSVGTVSHPAVTELYGYMANIASGASAGSTAGTGDNVVRWVRGSTSGANGFFFYARLAFPDSDYNETGTSTGTRIFVGLTDQTLANSVGSDNPTGNRIGFSRLHVNGSTTDTNWQISSRNVTAENRIDTGMLFVAQNVYDFYLFCAPQGNTINWRIDNLTADTTQIGSTSTNLPTSTTMMRAGFQLKTLNTGARNVRMQRVYTESDR